MVYFLIKKPFIVRPWTKNFSYEKECISTVHVWVRFTGLPIHYWGVRCLSRIAGMLGKVIRVDNATLKKDRMHFARVLVELDINGDFHDSISFTNEDDELLSIKVLYDWKPQFCSKCQQLVHFEDSCRTRVTTKWVPKTVTTIEIDKEFQPVPTRKAATVEPPAAAVLLDNCNGFEILAEINPEAHSVSEHLQSIALGVTSHPPNA